MEIKRNVNEKKKISKIMQVKALNSRILMGMVIMKKMFSRIKTLIIKEVNVTSFVVSYSAV